MSIPNVLASRYASPQMRDIWSPEAKIVAERKLWIAVLEAQRDLGVDFGGADADEVIAAYQGVIDQTAKAADRDAHDFRVVARGIHDVTAGRRDRH